MAYKYAKGKVFRGDIYNEDDSERNTYIDFGSDDYIGFVASGSSVLVVSGSKVGIGAASPTHEFEVYPNEDITAIIGCAFVGHSFNNDAATFGHRDLQGSHYALYQSAAGLTILNTGASQAMYFRIDNSNKAILDSNGQFGIGTITPRITLDVHYSGSGDPINLGNDTGGGEVVYFGTSSAALATGGIYYLNTGGGWESVDSATSGRGHNQLLAVSLGSKAAEDGMLIKGYFDVNAFYSGSFIKGGPMYIQSSSVGRTDTGGGYLSGAAPTNSDSYIRIVGYGTDTANVIYFNPDSTYVEIG